MSAYGATVHHNMIRSLLLNWYKGCQSHPSLQIKAGVFTLCLIFRLLCQSQCSKPGGMSLLRPNSCSAQAPKPVALKKTLRAHQVKWVRVQAPIPCTVRHMVLKLLYNFVFLQTVGDSHATRLSALIVL